MSHRALAQLCRADARGIVHVTNSGNCTWYDFATEIVRASGLQTTVKPVTTAEFPRPAGVPSTPFCRQPACMLTKFTCRNGVMHCGAIWEVLRLSPRAVLP